MNRLKRGAIDLSLVEELQKHGSWCGETSIQKAAYFLKYVMGVPLGYAFVLYKYGPYSFDLTEDLTALRADDVLDFKVRDPKYGPSYFPGSMAEFVRTRYPKTIAAHHKKIEFVAERLGARTVAELERLATALYVRLHHETGSPQEWAERIRELKPHISETEASGAIEEVEEIIDEASQLSVA